MLPSLGDIRREFELFAPALVEAGYRVITTDLRGMGSTGTFKSFNLSDLCNDITAILDAEKAGEVILVGLLDFGRSRQGCTRSTSRKSKEPGDIQAQ